jgi:YbbR domain-containing protein
MNLRRNLGLKLLSLLLAILGWTYFRFGPNPIVSTHFDQQLSVPIVAANLPDGYIVHFTDKEALVTVQTKRGDPDLKPDEVKAVLDLSNKLSGVYNIPVQLVAPNVVVQSLSPASISLTIERVAERSLPVTFHFSNEQTPVVIGSERATPSQITVHGPESMLGQIATVRVDVGVPTSPKSVDEMLRPVAVNSAGAEVSDVEVSPDLVRVQIAYVPGTGAKGK